MNDRSKMKKSIMHGYRTAEPNIPNKPFEDLAAAVVRQAVLDDHQYRTDLRRWQERAKGNGARYNSEIIRVEGYLKSIEQFFYGQWFECLCDANGPMIYRTIKNNYESGRRSLVQRGLKDVRKKV